MHKNNLPQKLLFIDRDGALIKEAPPTYQIDSFDKLEFYPKVFTYLSKIAAELDFKLVMVSNQDGLGTPSFPEENFFPVQNFILKSLANEGIHFMEIIIDKTFAHDNSPTRKPGTALLQKFINNADFDLQNSYVIGDRITDMQLAQNLTAKGLWLNADETLGHNEVNVDINILRQQTVVLETLNWADIYYYLKTSTRKITHVRNTNETKITIELNLEGTGNGTIKTGLPFFDHMLQQIAKHGDLDLIINCQGDLEIDEHHTIEDVGIALGEAIAKALGDKRGIERYGFLLPMDDSLAQVAIDFGGRNWIVWEADFKREKIGDMPTEMFFHFFKSFSDAAKCNLNIKAQGDNEHHKIESIFKAFAKALKMAIKKDVDNNNLPSTKGVL